MSGGVDSSVAAALLKDQGYEVIGLFMKNWHDDSVTESRECPWIEDSNDALRVAEKLEIPFQTIDLSEAYKTRVVDYMFREYEAGRTPNPDVLCNREIKFDLFLEAALRLKADHVATGHYCRKKVFSTEKGTYYRLLSGVDTNKDQSYFLCQVTQEQLKYALFPLGELTKPEVRKIAFDRGLNTANKKDSQGLCFVGQVHLPEFLQQRLAPKEGRILEISRKDAIFNINGTGSHPNGLLSLTNAHALSEAKEVTEVGTHKGAHFFTIGQRRGLGVGGTGDPLFVIGKDVETNILYAGRGNDHPGLYRSGLIIPSTDLHWVRPDRALQEGESERFSIRIRHRQPLQEGTAHRYEDGLHLVFDEPQRGIAAGQFAAWYDGDELIGSGVIG